MIAAYREPDRTKGRALMSALIESVSHGGLTAPVIEAYKRLGRPVRR